MYVNAELYKLLLYKEGDHFAPHRDTEKAPGMFATMTVLLPSQYKVCTVLLDNSSMSVIYAEPTQCWHVVVPYISDV